MARRSWRARSAVLALVSVSALAAFSVAYAEQEKGDTPPPGEIRLLPGYRHIERGGIDTIVGLIWKEGGPIVSYDIGPGFSSFATPRSGDNTVWVKKSTAGQKTKFVLNMQKDGNTFLVDIGCGSGFTAKNVRTKEDLADVLLMLMSHRPWLEC